MTRKEAEEIVMRLRMLGKATEIFSYFLDKCEVLMPGQYRWVDDYELAKNVLEEIEEGRM